MSDADTFDHIFRKYGGSLSLDSLGNDDIRSGASGLLSVFRYWVENSKNYQGSNLPFGNIYVDFVDNDSVNAIASIRGDNEFIGIFLGLIPVLALYFNAFMSDPQVFPDIGASKDEKQNPKTIDMFRPIDAEIEPQHPKDPLRQTVAARLNFLACSTVFYHEVGHLVCCHLPFLRDEFQMTDLEEFAIAPLSSEQAVIQRVLHDLEG
jgi:hypothetical protein